MPGDLLGSGLTRRARGLCEELRELARETTAGARCPFCHGSGKNRRADGATSDCPDCRGTGRAPAEPSHA